MKPSLGYRWARRKSLPCRRLLLPPLRLGFIIGGLWRYISMEKRCKGCRDWNRLPSCAEQQLRKSSRPASKAPSRMHVNEQRTTNPGPRNSFVSTLTQTSPSRGNGLHQQHERQHDQQYRGMGERCPAFAGGRSVLFHCE